MEKLVTWIDAFPDLHPLLVASLAHYHMVRIHPFDDGNGRGARLLMNLILMKYGYPPAIVRNNQRPKYINALISADQKNIQPFIMFIAESLTSTMEIILSDLENGK
jgi:Fic family protein